MNVIVPQSLTNSLTNLLTVHSKSFKIKVIEPRTYFVH